MNAGFPGAPIADGAGNITEAWRGFLLALYNRTGAAAGTSSAANAAAIAAETTARGAADTSLSTAIGSEAVTRLQADAAITAALSAESAARIAGDASQPAGVTPAQLWFGV